MTPNTDHPPEATIFEEGSAESWVDPHDPKSIEEQIMKEEEVNEDGCPEQEKNQCEQRQHNMMKRQQGMSSLLHGSNISIKT